MGKIKIEVPEYLLQLFTTNGCAWHEDNSSYYAFPYLLKYYLDDGVKYYELIPYNELDEKLLVNLLNLKHNDE